MIDLNRKPEPKPEKVEPEDIVIVVLAAVVWILIGLCWCGVL